LRAIPEVIGLAYQAEKAPAVHAAIKRWIHGNWSARR